jgi:hypothetical protein
MNNLFAKAGIAALIALSGLTATAPVASAQGRDGYYRDGPRFDRGPDRRDDFRRGPDRRDRCEIGLALDKAERRGMRRPQVADVNPRRVIVVGRNRGGPDRMAFANERGCPSIGR